MVGGGSRHGDAIILDMLKWCFFFSFLTQRDARKQSNVWLIFNVCLADSRQTCRHKGLKIKIGDASSKICTVCYTKSLPKKERKHKLTRLPSVRSAPAGSKHRQMSLEATCHAQRRSSLHLMSLHGLTQGS